MLIHNLGGMAAAAWVAWRWRRWRAAVVRAARLDFAEVTTRAAAALDAREWVEANEDALRWWFRDGASPTEAFIAVSEESNDG